MISPIERGKDRAKQHPKPISEEFKEAEKAKCAADFMYWCNTYAHIFDNETKSWILFSLWDAQMEAAQLALDNQYAMALKTRQIGITWLWAIALKLWKMIFHPITQVLVFSQGEDEAYALLGEQRMRGMYSHLPEWMQLGLGSVNSKSQFSLDNGSGIEALPPTRGGDSRTVTDLVIDEADLIENFSELLARAEPTVGRNGSILLIGRAAKKSPNSPFKRMYKAARAGDSKYKAIFIPWYAHPEWDQTRYDREKADIFNRTGSLDDLYEQHPATDTEALAARSLDKRFHPDIIQRIHRERKPIDVPGAPIIPGLRIYRAPEAGRTYGIGADPSGGTTDGDPAVASVGDAGTYEQVAVLECKAEADVFANYVATLAEWYNKAAVLFELNNHGLAMLANLKAHGVTLRHGINRRGDTGKPGWLTTAPSKHMLYDTAAKVFEDVMREAAEVGQPILPVIYDLKTAVEMSSIDVDTLSAPEGDHDDHAMAFVLMEQCIYRGVSSMQTGHHNLWAEEQEEPAHPQGTPALLRREEAPRPVERVTGVSAETEIQEMLKRRGISGGGRW